MRNEGSTPRSRSIIARNVRYWRSASLTYARFHIAGGTSAEGTRLLGVASVERMREIEYSFVPNRQWGLAWELQQFGGKRALGHGRATVGQLSLLNVLPEEGFAIATFTNSATARPLNQEMLRLAMKLYFDIDVPKPGPIECSADDLRQFVGRYERAEGSIELALVNGRLVAQVLSTMRLTQDAPPPPGPPQSLTLAAHDGLYVQDGPTAGTVIDVVRAPEGSVGWLRAGLRIFRRV